MLILIGNVVGLMFAIVALAIGAISFPMLLDKPVGLATAVETSVRAVMANPIPLAAWGIFVALSLLVSALPLLVGLAVMVPGARSRDLAPLPEDRQRLRRFVIPAERSESRIRGHEHRLCCPGFRLARYALGRTSSTERLDQRRRDGRMDDALSTALWITPLVYGRVNSAPIIVPARAWSCRSPRLF